MPLAAARGRSRTVAGTLKRMVTRDPSGGAGPRFYLDENLSHRLAVLARARGLDVTSAQELGRHGLSDEAQLAYAAADGRCIVSHDDEDLLDWTFRFQASGRAHAGLLIVKWQVRKRHFAFFIEALDRFVQDHPAPLAPYEINWLARP